MFEDVFIDRHPGHNAAYWDLANRKITKQDGQYFVNGLPLIFFHFSGYSPLTPDVISKHQNRFSFKDQLVLRELFDDYGKRLLAKGYNREETAPILPEEKLARVYRKTVQALATAGLEPMLTKSLGQITIHRIQRIFVKPPPPLAGPARGVAETTLGVNVLGFFEHVGSSGEGARRVVRALSEAGLPVTWTTLERSPAASAVSENLSSPRNDVAGINLWYVNPDYLPRVFEPNNEINIAYFAWELPEFPLAWEESLKNLDEIWVYSNFIRQAITPVAQKYSVPVVTVGAPLEKTLIAPFVRQRSGLPEDKFSFLFIFDMASHMERKNPHAFVEAYRRAFGEDSQDTLLAIKIINGQRYPLQRRRLKKLVRSVNGILIDEVMPRSVLSGLIAECDAYVSLHRAEGFGLTIAEAMQLGKPVIATNYSGNTDFMTEQNSYPIPYQLIELRKDVGPYRKGQMWAEPDMEAAAQAMRQVLENTDKAQRRGIQAARDITSRYSPEVFASQAMARLRIFS